MKILETLNTEVAGRKSSRTLELEALLQKASKVYYNTGKFLTYKGELIDDKRFDELVEELRERHPTSEVLKTVGAPVPVKKGKVKLPYYMGSMDKIKSDTADAWLKANKGPYVASDKIDGVSIELVFSKTGQTKAYTRGDGSVGQDISFLVPHMKLPKVKNEIAVRGEIAMPRAKFEALWKKEFENARNMVSGLVNRKDVHKAIKDIDVVVYEQLYPRTGTHSKTLSTLKSMGFHVVAHKVFDKLDASTLSAILTKRKKESKYDIDGMVITLDRNNPLNTSGNPDWGRAFKQTSEDDIVQTTVTNVEWNPSKNTLLKPRVQIVPVRLSGAKVSFATGFNAKFIIDHGVGPGAVIRITRSGDVIPHILEVVKKVKPQLPSKEFQYEWNKTKVDFVLKNAEEFDDYHVKRMVHFFKTIGVEYFSEGLVARFMEHGYDSIKSLLKAKVGDFMEIEGIQDKMANKIYTNIQTNIKNVPLAKLMDATGIYSNLGERRIQMVLDVYPNILYEYSSIPKNSMITRITDNVRGYKTVTATAFVDGLPKFEKWLANHPMVSFELPKKKRVVKGGSLEGKSIVFTGYRDAQAEETIKKLGGEVGSGVSSKTTILVVKDKSSASGKTAKAKSLGVKIMDAKEFTAWLAKQ